eukprot:538434_1
MSFSTAELFQTAIQKNESIIHNVKSQNTKGNDNNTFQHKHININNIAHKQHNSLASISNNSNWNHGRNNTFSKYNSDDTLEVIEGNIQTQKDIMQDFFQERVNQH